jgi:L-2-hydroxyglutarate oxidase LhgO
MRFSDEQKAHMKKLDAALLSSIASRTKLSQAEIKRSEIGVIEKKVGIKAAGLKIYFSWERTEKDGWQILKFVDEKTLDKRERRVEKELSGHEG